MPSEENRAVGLPGTDPESVARRGIEARSSPAQGAGDLHRNESSARTLRSPALASRPQSLSGSPSVLPPRVSAFRSLDHQEGCAVRRQPEQP